jgi:hypothetical protein
MRALSSGYDDGSNSDARRVAVNTDAFDGNLSQADDTVQKALETLDDLVITPPSETDPLSLHLDQTTPQTLTATDVTITATDEIYYGDVTDSTKIKKDTVQGILDLVPAPRDHWRGVSATEPEGVEGDYYINSVDNGYYIYYNGGWSLVATTIPPITTTGILLESGDYLLLETGDIILKES